MIFHKVIKEGDIVIGVYESDSTELFVRYKNKGGHAAADTERSFVDVEEFFKFFETMEILDRRKGRR